MGLKSSLCINATSKIFVTHRRICSIILVWKERKILIIILRLKLERTWGFCVAANAGYIRPTENIIHCERSATLLVLPLMLSDLIGGLKVTPVSGSNSQVPSNFNCTKINHTFPFTYFSFNDGTKSSLPV